MTSRGNKKQMQRTMGVRSMKNPFGVRQLQGMAMAGGVKMIEGDDKVRQEKCLAEIQGILGRYDCDMIPEITIAPGQIRAMVRIQAKPRAIVPQ